RREPLRRLQRHLKERGILDDDRIEALENAISEQIDEAWQETEQAMQELDEPLDIFSHNYAELPRTLREQREEMASRLGEG
ncbi:MAG: hypothetical protein ACOCWF_08570, partial [Halochromatium sp.]